MNNTSDSRRSAPTPDSRSSLSVLAIGCFALAAVASPPGDFYLNREWPINKRPTDLCAVDLNGDTRPDLVSCGGYGLKVSYYEGSRDFGAPVDIDALLGLAVRGADLDADTDIDLVVAADSTMRVLLNDGSGTMGAPTILAMNGARVVELGDLTGDGRPDAVTVNPNSDTISVLLNDGNGALALPVDYPAGNAPGGAIIADLDGDLDNDVAVYIPGSSGAIGMFFNDGSGTLAPMVSIPFSRPRSIAAGDFDGDGDVDIAIESGVSTAYFLTILFNSGAGAFAPGAALPLPDVTGTLAAGDLDGDLDIDLAYSSGNGASTIRVLPNNGSGMFTTGSVWAIGFGPYAVRIADFDGDGIQDLAEPNQTPGSSTVLFNAGGGVFRTEFNQSVALAFGVSRDGALADVDGDGDADALCITDPGQSLTRSMSVAVNGGTGSFSEGSVVTVGTDPSSIVAADLNGDTFADAVITHTSLDSIGVVLSTGPGTYAAEATYAVGGSPYRSALGDVSGDGNADIAVCNFFDGTVSLMINSGAGAFVPGAVLPVGNFPQALALVDVNGDTLLDLITADGGDDTVSVLLNTGAGVFGPATPYAAGDNPIRLCAADLDGDTDLDLIVSDDGSGSIVDRVDDGLTILLNNGSGAFGSPIFLEVVDRPRQVEFADIDLSGDNDILVCGSSGDLVVLLSDGPLSFPDLRTYGASIATVNRGGVVAFGATDFDGDTDIDVLSVCTQSAAVISLNRLLTPTPACAGDINGDSMTNAADFVILAGSFGSVVAPNTNGDLNGDGLVNAADFTILAGNFGCDQN